MRSDTAISQGSPCERRCGRPRILLRSQLRQEEAEKRMDHVLWFGDKEIKEWCGIHCGFSMWEEGVSSIRGEIVSERFRKDHDVWARVS